MINVDGNEDEEVFFTPITSSNLATLFNTTMLLPNQNRESSLTYKPPKQPGAAPSRSGSPPKSPKTNKAKHQSSLILFKEVHAFQVVNKKYLPTGRCGLALVGNDQVKLYQLLIYKQKNDIISTTKVTPSFEFLIQKNNYITINDDTKLTWTIHFGSEADLNEFSKIMSDKSSCRILSDQPQIKDQKKENEKPKKGENIPKLEKVHPKDPNTEPNIKGKFDGEAAKDVNITKIIAESEIECVPKNIDSDASDSSGTNHKKADILSRVAKMGKKIISKSQLASDSSDVDEPNKKSPEVKVSMRNTTPNNATNEEVHVSEKNSVQNCKTEGSSENICSQSLIPKMSDNQVLLRPSVMVPFQDATQLMYSTAHMPADQLNIFFAENRTHSSEMRMNLMRLQTGVEEVLNIIKKSESLRYENSSQTEETDNGALLKEHVRLADIISEREKSIEDLKSTLETYKKRADDLVRKETERTFEIASLTQETARCTYEEHKLNMKVKDQQAQLLTQTAKITEYEKKLEYLNSRYCDCVHIKKTKLPEMKDSIKEQMNLFYNETCGIFKGESTYDGNHIKKILAPIIIDNTYKILNTLSELFNASEN